MNWRKNLTYPLISKYQKSTELSHLSDLKRSQYFSQTALQDLRAKKLKTLLHESSKHVPYYKETFDKYNINLSQIQITEDLNKIPTLSRKVVQEEFENLVSKKLNQNLIQTASGGSTGDPARILYSLDNLHRRNAAAKRHDEWAGLQIGEKHSIIWGARKDFKKNTLKSKVWSFLTSNNIVLDSSSISEKSMKEFLKLYNKFKPKSILGYAQSLVYISEYLSLHNLTINKPKTIISSAELLTQNNRILIEKTFKAPVYNRYGTRETSVIASECENHSMHVRDEDIILEVLKEDGTNCDYDEEGEIVITDLTNFAFPLLRYKIGDMGVKTQNICKCGRKLSTIKILSGRTTDFIFTPLNRKVSGVAVLGYICSDLPGLSKVQFHQKENNKVTLKLLPNTKFNSSTIHVLEKRIRSFLDNIEPKIEVVNTIEATSTGKFRVVINEIMYT